MAETADPPRGLYCPVCRGVRLTVRHTLSTVPGAKNRYRVCTVCGSVLYSREVIVSVVRRGNWPK